MSKYAMTLSLLDLSYFVYLLPVQILVNPGSHIWLLCPHWPWELTLRSAFFSSNEHIGRKFLDCIIHF